MISRKALAWGVKKLVLTCFFLGPFSSVGKPVPMSPVALLGLGPLFSLWRPTNARAHPQVAALSRIGGGGFAWPY